MKDNLGHLRNQPIVPLLVFENSPIVSAFDEEIKKNTPEAMAQLFYALLYAQVKPTFHKINIHAAMTPIEIKTILEPAFSQAKYLQQIHQQKNEEQHQKRSPLIVTVS